MADHPIPFSGPMVRAILEGRKTVTRRPVRSAHSKGADAWCWVPDRGEWESGIAADYGRYGHGEWVKCPYGVPGDRLWVRETWTSAYARGLWGTLFQADMAFQGGARAHERGPHFSAEDVPPWVKWRPSIHMPHWASRLTLVVTGVRVERLNRITEEQAEAEGFARRFFQKDAVDCGNGVGYCDPPTTALGEFMESWDTIYKGPYSVAENPWVWVIEFERFAV